MPAEVAPALTPEERKRFHDLRDSISTNLESVIKVGEALAEIKTKKLYREEFKSWDEFVQIYHNIRRRYADQLIGAFEVCKSLEINKKVGSIVPNLPKNNEQLNALSSVPEDQRVEVLDKAASNGPITAKSIKEAAKTIAKVLDKTGWPVPDRAMACWSRMDEIRELLTAVTRIKSAINTAFDEKDVMFAEINFSSAMSACSNLYSDIKRALPYAVCGTCQGQLPHRCTLCKGRGIISQFTWDTCVPDEIKMVRQKSVKGMK